MVAYMGGGREVKETVVVGDEAIVSRIRVGTGGRQGKHGVGEQAIAVAPRSGVQRRGGIWSVGKV